MLCNRLVACNVAPILKIRVLQQNEVLLPRNPLKRHAMIRYEEYEIGPCLCCLNITRQGFSRRSSFNADN